MKVKFKDEDKVHDLKVVISHSTGVRIDDATPEQIATYLKTGSHTHKIKDDVLHADFNAPENMGTTLRLFQYDIF